MADVTREQLEGLADQLEAKANEALDRGLDFVNVAGGGSDPSAALSDFERAGALCAAASKCRQRASEI